MLPGPNYHILCVDDSLQMVEMVKAVLGGFGYAVDGVQNGFAALMKIGYNANRFQLIVIDLRMPGMDGFELIERARAAGYDGQFVVFAASVTEDARARLRELRIDHVIDKGARGPGLLAAVREIQNSF